MGKERLVRIAALLVICFVLFSCGKENNSSSENNKGSVYGTVIDLGTNEPVANATVRLKPGYHSGYIYVGYPELNEHSCLTGYDGMFEFFDVEAGKYHITVSKTEYDDLIDDFVIEVLNGKQIRRDVQIEKLPVVYTNDVTEIISLGYSGWNEVNWSATFNGYVASIGSPAYVERGFAYSDNPPYETYVLVPGNGTGNYSKTVTGLSQGKTYYVRAYVKSYSEQLIFGPTISFSTPNAK